MYLYGASGHAKVVIDILEILHIRVSGLFDDNSALSSLLNYDVSVMPDIPDLHEEPLCSQYQYFRRSMIVPNYTTVIGNLAKLKCFC